MMEKFCTMLGKAIVAAFLEWAGVKDLDDLLARGTAALGADVKGIEDKIEGMPAQIVGQIMGPFSALVAQVTAMPGQIAGQVIGKLPDFAQIIQQAIGQFNPFK